jgi:dihydrodiol dehydrogenase / D-xylose 1-dehydrogenase (NADP)
MFVTDLLVPRENGSAKHTVTAIGTSSNIDKGHKFVAQHWEKLPTAPRPKVFASYQEVYDSPDVDLVYIATPHSLHMQNCLDAIKSGKHVLCEKPFTINAKEAQVIVDAARAKGVFLVEGEPYRTYSSNQDY